MVKSPVAATTAFSRASSPPAVDPQPSEPTDDEAKHAFSSQQPWTVRLSVMDMRMNAYSFRVLYVFRARSDEHDSVSKSDNATPNTSIDLTRLEQSFYDLLCDDYPFFLRGELAVDPTTGVLCLRSRPSDNQTDGAQYEQLLQIAPLATETTTQDALSALDVALVPPREPQELVAVLCTPLCDGGLALGLNINHCVFDAASCFQFVNQWGLHYTGVSRAARPVICHNRHVLAAQGRAVAFAHPEYTLVPLGPRVEAPSATPTPLPTSPPPTTQRVFRLTRDELQRLKAFVATGLAQDAVGSTTNPSFISSIDALTALLVVLITRARGHSNAVNVGTAVNGRRRLEPPLPANYAGNAVFTAFSRVDAQELQDTTPPAIDIADGKSTATTSSSPSARLQPKQLAAIARRIRASIQRQDGAFMRDTIEFLAPHYARGSLTRVEATTKFFFGSDLMFSSWIGLGALEASFSGERPVCVTSPALPVCDGVVVLLEGGGDRYEALSPVDVLVYLESAAMARLETLWSLAAPQCWSA